MLIDPAAYYLAYDALTHAGPASPSRFPADGVYCDYFTNSTEITLVPEDVEAVVLAALRLFTAIDSPGARSLVEPPLMVRVLRIPAYVGTTYTDATP